MNKSLNSIMTDFNITIDTCINKELLAKLTSRSELAYAQKLDWKKVRHLNIIGSDRSWTGGIFAFAKPKLKKGCYTDPTGEWVLLAGLVTSDIQNYVDLCPPELESLFIGHTDLTALRIPSFHKLRSLRLICNEDLSTVSGLQTLPSLETLSLYASRCTFTLDLSPYPLLQILIVSSTQLQGILLDRPLMNLRNCRLMYCHFSDMDFLEYCPALSYLALSGNPINRLPDSIRKMKKLQQLTLWNLSLEDLPDWLPELGLTIGTDHGCAVSLRQTTVEGVDMAIFAQSQEMIRAWFESRKKTKSGGPLNEIKVVFLGDGSTGKSLTVSRLMQKQIGDQPEHFDGEATPGIAIADRELTLPDERKIQVHFWDFGGQEILHCMHRIFLTDRTLYVVMINARNNTQDDQARYWLHNVSSFAPGCPVLLVLNQIDQNPNASVNERSLKRLYPNLQQVIRLSALNFDREAFNNAFTAPMLAQIARFDSLGAFFPPEWKKIMDEVRAMDGNFIRGSAFYKICKNSGVEDRKLCLDLLKWFHDIGVSFCCGGSVRLRDYVVLKPEWITNAIYTILWNKRSDTANGMVDQDEIYRLLTSGEDGSVKQVRSDMTYTLEDVDYVLNITRQFRLSFPMDSEHEFIPMLCGANAIPEADTFPEEPDVIEFRMEYDYLPANVLHRLMVDMRQDLLPDKVWLTGALFQQKLNSVCALIKSEGDILSIYIRTTDPGHRAHTYLNTLRGALEAIHKDMGLKPPKMLAAYTEEDQTEYFPYKMLEGARQNGQITQYSQVFDKMIPIDVILNGTDSRIAAQKEKLLRDLARICLGLRANRNMNNAHEDDRNDVLRDALRYMGYRVADQTHVGHGKTGRRAGSLDLQLLHEDDLPWTNLEAMNLNGMTKTQINYWNDHLNRLLVNYNPAGLPSLFLISYVNCSADTYHTLFSAYAEHMRFYQPPNAELRQGTLTEVLPLKDQHAFVRVTRCTYDRGGTPVTVYHYFVGFTEDMPDGE